MAPLTVEDDYAIADTATWFDERATPCDRLDRIFEHWRQTRGVYPYGSVEFLGWLRRLGVQVTGLYGDDRLSTGNTCTSENFLNEDFGYTLFTIRDTTYIALTDAVSVSDLTFYQLTCDDPAEFYDWDTGSIWCNGPEQHVFDTDDTITWRRYDDAMSEYLGDEAQLHELQDDDGVARCPVCGAPITTGETR
jgi:hypothetical protein